MPNTRARLPWHRGETGVGRERLDALTRGKIQGEHQCPGRRDPANAFDALQAFGCLRPLRILIKSRSNFYFDIIDLTLKGAQ